MVVMIETPRLPHNFLKGQYFAGGAYVYENRNVIDPLMMKSM